MYVDQAALEFMNKTIEGETFSFERGVASHLSFKRGIASYKKPRCSVNVNVESRLSNEVIASFI